MTQLRILLLFLFLSMIPAQADWFSADKDDGSTGALAVRTPTGAQAFLGLDFEHPNTRRKLVDLLNSLAESGPELNRQFQKRFGLTPAEWSELLGGRVLVALVPSGSRSHLVHRSPPQFLVAFTVRPSFQSWFDKHLLPRLGRDEGEPVHGVRTFYNRDLRLGLDRHWLYFAAGGEAYEAMLKAALAQGESLADNPRYSRALAGLPPQKGQLYLYLDVASQMEGASRFLRRRRTFDDFSVRSLKSLDYLAVSVDFEARLTDALLGVAGNGTELSRNLLTRGSFQAASTHLVPSDIDAYLGVDANWLGNLIFSVVRLDARARFGEQAQLSRIPLIGGYLDAVAGELSAGARLGEVIRSQGKNPPALFWGIPLNNIKKTHQMLGLLGRKFSPSEKLPKVPNLGERVTFGFGATGHFALENGTRPTLQGAYGSEGARWLESRNRSQFRLNEELLDLANWAGEGLVWLDYLDLEAYADEIISVGTREFDDLGPLILELREKVGPLRGVSCLVVRPEGLRYRSRGLGSSVGFVLGILGAGIFLF